jgi:hypothetical protein
MHKELAYRQTVEREEPVHVVDGEVGCQWKKPIVFLHLMAKKKKERESEKNSI